MFFPPRDTWVSRRSHAATVRAREQSPIHPARSGGRGCLVRTRSGGQQSLARSANVIWRCSYSSKRIAKGSGWKAGTTRRRSIRCTGTQRSKRSSGRDRRDSCALSMQVAVVERRQRIRRAAGSDSAADPQAAGSSSRAAPLGGCRATRTAVASDGVGSFR